MNPNGIERCLRRRMRHKHISGRYYTAILLVLHWARSRPSETQMWCAHANLMLNRI